MTAPAHTDKDKEGNEIEVPETVVTQGRRPARGHDAREARRSCKPVFKPDGTVTAGNACPLNDGAAALLVISEERAEELGLKPKVRIIASTVAAIRPEIMGLGPIPAIEKLLKKTGMKMSDIDVVEINEAFAAQIVPCKEELGIDDEKLNPFGGAIALGHPFGMTGARIMTTLINDLRDARRHLRHRVDVRRRRHGHGDARGTAQLNLISMGPPSGDPRGGALNNIGQRVDLAEGCLEALQPGWGSSNARNRLNRKIAVYSFELG